MTTWPALSLELELTKFQSNNRKNKFKDLKENLYVKEAWRLQGQQAQQRKVEAGHSGLSENTSQDSANLQGWKGFQVMELCSGESLPL